MNALIAFLAALGLVASPALAQTNTNTKAKPPASKSVAGEAKAEHESAATEAKEHKAARHHRHHAKKHHAKKHHAMKKTVVKKTTMERRPANHEQSFRAAVRSGSPSPAALAARKHYEG